MPYQHILIAVDLTDECHPVAERALAIAASSGAKTSLVHIVEPMAMAFGGDVPMDLSMLQQQQFDQARERLDTFAGRYPQLGAEQRHLAYGQPRQEIHRLAEEQGCDLIVEAVFEDVGVKAEVAPQRRPVLRGAEHGRVHPVQDHRRGAFEKARGLRRGRPAHGSVRLAAPAPATSLHRAIAARPAARRKSR